MSSPRSDPPPTAARLRHAVRLGLSAESRARGGPRSAPAGDRAARRARWARGGRAGRRSRLGRAARRPGAQRSTARRRRCRSMPSSRSIRRCRTCIGSTTPARRRSCMRRRRPIASARISTGRTCWRAGSASRARPTPAGSTARSPRWRRPAAPAARDAFAVGPIAPLVVRGPAPVLSWTPRRLPPASDDTLMRLLDLYRHTDPALARVLEERVGLATIARAGGMDGEQPRAAPAPDRCGPISPNPPAPRRSFSPGRTGRASARSPSTAGIPTPTKAR